MAFVHLLTDDGKYPASVSALAISYSSRSQQTRSVFLGTDPAIPQ
jgi:hypothetical protein